MAFLGENFELERKTNTKICGKCSSLEGKLNFLALASGKTNSFQVLNSCQERRYCFYSYIIVCFVFEVYVVAVVFEYAVGINNNSV